MARQKAVELTTIWKDKNVTSALKIRVMKSMVWAVFQYGVEGWTIKKSDRNTLCPNKKHVTTFYTITLTISVRLQ